MMDMPAFYDLMLECGMRPPPKDEWLERVSRNSELWPICKEGKFVGGILFVGQTIHIAVLPEWHQRWVTKSILRGFRNWQHDCPIEASPEKSNVIAIEFVKRLGFKYHSHYDGKETYIKEPTCPQP